MKPTFEIPPALLDNQDKFQDPFFKRFKLRHAPQPIQLTDKIAKNYFFPTLYHDVTCAIGIFMCDYAKAQSIMPHSSMRPVRMTKGRALVTFSCYTYRHILGVRPYNEIAMTIPVMVDSSVNIPVLPMLMMGLFKKLGFGYYVFGMPVTSKENELRGRKIWGLPKVTQEIDIFEDGIDCTTVAKELSGEPYFELRVPIMGQPMHANVSGNLYSRLNDKLLQSETRFEADFTITKYMKILRAKNEKPDRQYLKIGSSPSADILKYLQIEEHPFQFRYAKKMNSAFDLPNQNYNFNGKFDSPIEVATKHWDDAIVKTATRLTSSSMSHGATI